MKKRVRARLHWNIQRRNPAASYSTLARFDLQGANWMNETCWSLIVESNSSPDARGFQIAYIHFVVDAAPQEWLTPGRRFWLQEGFQVTAEGEVLGDES